MSALGLTKPWSGIRLALEMILDDAGAGTGEPS